MLYFYTIEVEGLTFKRGVTDRLKKRAILLEAADKAGLKLLSDNSAKEGSDSNYKLDK